MIKSTPYEYLKKFLSIDKSVGLFPVIILDNVLDILDTILPVPPGHNVSANDHSRRFCQREFESAYTACKPGAFRRKLTHSDKFGLDKSLGFCIK